MTHYYQKRLVFLLAAFATMSHATAQVGIGTTTPETTAELHVETGSSTVRGLLVTGQANPGAASVPDLGPGSRLMFYPAKGAFRVGTITGTQWNNANVGYASFAAGSNSLASGEQSVAVGDSNTASGQRATALGYWSVASGNGAIALGMSATASGNNALALGASSIASGDLSVALHPFSTASANGAIALGGFATSSGINAIALGNSVTSSGTSAIAIGNTATASAAFTTSIGVNTVASATRAIALGSQTTASGQRSIAMGDSTVASGTASATLGRGTRAKGFSSTVVGMYNDTILTTNQTAIDPNTPLFIVGNGNGNAVRSNAMIVQKNGNVGIGNIVPDNAAQLHVHVGNETSKGLLVQGTTSGSASVPNLGAGARMMFYPGMAAFRAGLVTGTQWDNANVGYASFAAGSNTVASGAQSVSLGDSNTASGQRAAALGYWSVASGNGAIALGMSATASGNNALALGASSTASGDLSVALHPFSTASANGAIALGGFATASGINSIAVGNSVTSNGTSAIAIGNTATASGAFTTSIGINTVASATRAIALGSQTTANGQRSIAMGDSTIASGTASSTLGRGNIAKGFSSTVVGMYNDTILTANQTAVTSTTPLFIVGNGDGNAARSNAFVVRKDGTAVLAGTLTQNSDARLKTNITPLVNAMSLLAAINGYSYNWKDQYRDQQTQIGVLAQEVQKVFPELVKEDEKGVLSVNYNGFVPVLINAMKEQHSVLKTKEQQIDELKERLEKLETLVAQQQLSNKH